METKEPTEPLKFHLYKSTLLGMTNGDDYIVLTPEEHEEENPDSLDTVDDMFTYEYLGVFSRDRRETH